MTLLTSPNLKMKKWSDRCFAFFFTSNFRLQFHNYKYTLYFCLSASLSIIIYLKRHKNMTCRNPLLFIFEGRLPQTENALKLFANKFVKRAFSMLTSAGYLKPYLMRLMSFPILYHCSKYGQCLLHVPLTLNLSG